MGITPHLTAHEEISGGKAVVVEVGGGSTELLIVRDGNVIYSGSFRLGSLRLLRMLDASRAGASRHRACWKVTFDARSCRSRTTFEPTSQLT